MECFNIRKSFSRRVSVRRKHQGNFKGPVLKRKKTTFYVTLIVNNEREKNGRNNGAFLCSPALNKALA